MADGLGFEPRKAEPESAVLPLHYPSTMMVINLILKSLVFQRFLLFFTFSAFLTLVHVSFRVTVRLNIFFPSFDAIGSM
jgi:hypothetical protein